MASTEFSLIHSRAPLSAADPLIVVFPLDKPLPEEQYGEQSAE